MGFRRLETLGDLAEAGFRLIVGCRQCGHVRALRPVALFRSVTPMRAWSLVKFRCARCGGRDVMRGIDKDAP